MNNELFKKHPGPFTFSEGCVRDHTGKSMQVLSDDYGPTFALALTHEWEKEQQSGDEKPDLPYLTTMVYEALGEVSMLWEPRPAGVFQSTEADAVGKRLMANINAYLKAIARPDVSPLSARNV